MAPVMAAVTRCNSYDGPEVRVALQRQFEYLGGLKQFVRSGDRVLLKPNFIVARSRRSAATTHPAIIIEVAKLLIDFGAKPFVADSPAWGTVEDCVKRLKLEEPFKKLNIGVRQLNKPVKCILEDGTKVGISSVVFEADAIINLPKFKSHQQLVATFAIKNMFGCVSGKRKTFWHFAKGKNSAEFCRFLIGIYKYLKPCVMIIDAVQVMDGQGPIRGRARNLGWLIGGVEPVLCEAVCCRLIALEPDRLPILNMAREMDFGCWDLEKAVIKGDDFAELICGDFELPALIPIKFSLVHVCRSVIRQILLLVRSKSASGN